MWELINENQWSKSSIHVSQIHRLEDAFVVASLLKKNSRIQIASSEIYNNAKLVHGVDGAIMIGRLAAGNIDAYVDPYKGQPIYEVPCCELILKAGGVVTDANGKRFRLAEIVNSLKKNPKERYKIIAASTSQLHREIINGL